MRCRNEGGGSRLRSAPDVRLWTFPGLSGRNEGGGSRLRSGESVANLLTDAAMVCRNEGGGSRLRSAQVQAPSRLRCRPAAMKAEARASARLIHGGVTGFTIFGRPQ